MEHRNRLEIEQAAFADFLERWHQGAFAQQRLGQAFYNHFKLHALSEQAELHALYEADGKKALALIARLFDVR